MQLDEYQDALDEAASAVGELLAFDQLCAARGYAPDEQQALAAIAGSAPGLELARLWELDGGDDADRMRAAFERELTERGLWSTTRRAFAQVREHVRGSHRPAPPSRPEQDAATIAELVALARRGSPADDRIAVLGAEALAAAATPEGRRRALQLLEEAHVEAGDDALGVIRVSAFDAQMHEASGNPALARKLYREILQYGRGVEGAGAAIECAALRLGRSEASIGHAFRARQNLDLAAELARARASR